MQGRADAPIAIITDGGVTLNANGSGSGMVLANVRYLVTDGLTNQNTGIHGLSISDGDDYATPSEFVVLRDTHFRNIGSDGIIQQDPLLDADYRITAGSPAIGGGIDIPGGMRLEFDGIEYSNPPPIGAFSRP